MRHSERNRWLFAIVLLMGLGLPSLAAAEDECSADADCPDGFVCESHQEPCPAIDCADGQDCSNECDPATVKECVPEPPESCTAASDCDPDLVCVTVTYEACSGTDVACAPGEDCDAGSTPDASCTTETEGYCVPPYLAPCQVNADCGAGFTCEESEVCQCSGGGSTGSGGTSTDPDGSVDAGSSDDNCSCSGTGEFYCELIEQECSADSDCAGDLICDELPWGSADGGDVEVCTSTPDGGTSCESDGADAGTSTEPTKYCQPADIERWIGAAGAVRGDEDNASGSGSSEDGRELVSSDVDRGGSGSSGGGGSSESAGCSSTGTGGAAGSLGALLIAFLGLVGIRRRG